MPRNPARTSLRTAPAPAGDAKTIRYADEEADAKGSPACAAFVAWRAQRKSASSAHSRNSHARGLAGAAT